MPELLKAPVTPAQQARDALLGALVGLARATTSEPKTDDTDEVLNAGLRLAAQPDAPEENIKIGIDCILGSALNCAPCESNFLGACICACDNRSGNSCLDGSCIYHVGNARPAAVYIRLYNKAVACAACKVLDGHIAGCGGSVGSPLVVKICKYLVLGGSADSFPQMARP